MPRRRLMMSVMSMSYFGTSWVIYTLWLIIRLFLIGRDVPSKLMTSRTCLLKTTNLSTQATCFQTKEGIVLTSRTITGWFIESTFHSPSVTWHSWSRVKLRKMTLAWKLITLTLFHMTISSTKELVSQMETLWKKTRDNLRGSYRTLKKLIQLC